MEQDQMREQVDNIKADIERVSYAVLEATNERAAQREKRFFAVIILLISLLVATNAAWLFYEFSMETVEETTTVETTIDAVQDGESYNMDGGLFLFPIYEWDEERDQGELVRWEIRQ